MRYLPLNQRPQEDRPREKLLSQGASALTNAELLAIVLGSGTFNINALDLAQQILQAHDGDLEMLARCSINDLKKFTGIGTVKAVTLMGAMELALRRTKHQLEKKIFINKSKEVHQLMHSHLSGRITEEFWVILLTSTHRLIRKCRVSTGGLTKTVVDPKVVFGTALQHGAPTMIVVHNHPSGDAVPSSADKILTERLAKGAELMGITLLDHLIYTDKDFFSFVDHGLL